MAAPIRIPINIDLLGDGYTGKLYVGSQRNEVNLLLDTGSSSLAVVHKSYNPLHDTNATLTKLVQEVDYADSSNWIGSIVKTDMSVSASGRTVDLPGVAVAVAYHETADMFGKAQGILGLAYKRLDDAVRLKQETVPPKYTSNEIRSGHRDFVEPYFTQLEKARLAANRFAFYTRRSVRRESVDPAADRLNKGFLILGGGEEAIDLYRGSFQSAVVLSDDYYSVNLRSVSVGRNKPIPVDPPTRQSKERTNAIVDSGTNGLDLAPHLHHAIVKQLSPSQQKLIGSNRVLTSSLKLAEWPTLTFVLQGEQGNVALRVTPQNYWQLDAGKAGLAQCGLWRGDDTQSILGLPLMNEYFTIFDGSANHGRGVVKFAKIKK